MEYLTQLRQILTERFDGGELRTLCFDLGIRYDDLPGEGNADKARELVAYLERRDRISELVKSGRQLRPDISWDAVLEKAPLFPQRTPFISQISHNLPPRSEFVGREAEKARVHEALCSRSYLISIDGIGGIGKSSLALEVAFECLQASREESPVGEIATFEGFIWTTAKDRDLDLDDLLDAIALTLEYPGIARHPVEKKGAAVRKLLQNKPYLLIVDNFETITDDGIRDFLLNLPEPSKALITTREQKLRRVWAVSLKGLAESEALTLIRTTGRQLGLTALERGDDQVLRHLVEATGGVPLAIKWAVGQIKQRGQSLDTVLAALHEARGNIFDNIFIRSWDLLSTSAQQVLIVTPIFTASASRAGIEAASDVHHFALDEALGQLVEMSLVEATDELDLARRRYSIHPLTRAFAAAKLKRQPEIHQVAQQRLAEFYEVFTKEQGGTWYREGYAHPESELLNILAIIQWCWERQLVDLGINIFLNLPDFMDVGGYWNDILTLGKQAVALATAMGDELGVARTQTRLLGWVYRHRGDLGAAEACITQALAVFERFDEKKDTAHAKRNLGRIAQARGDTEQAEQLFREAIALYKSVGDTSGLYWATANRADVALQRGNLDSAWALGESALEYARQSGHQEYAVLQIRGDVERQRGNIKRAKAFWEQALIQAKRANHYSAIADVSSRLAQVEIQTGQIQMARQMLMDALKIYRRLDIQFKVQKVEELLSELTLSNDHDEPKRERSPNED